MIKLIAVSKTYGKLTALGQTDLEIRKGDFIMVEGPSGSGKSTLLKILGGLIRPSTGKIFFESQDLNLLSESKLALWRRKNLGFVFQQFNLIEYLSALDNVALPLLYEKVSSKQARSKAEKILRLVGLEAWKDHPANQLSGGQAQRVAIARCLANDPNLILCDEPTGALDPQSVKKIMELLKYVNGFGKTIVIVTHDPSIIHYGNRHWYLNQGQVQHD
jgi:putative ABC transport system ATP-binding protein